MLKKLFSFSKKEGKQSCCSVKISEVKSSENKNSKQ